MLMPRLTAEAALYKTSDHDRTGVHANTSTNKNV